MTATTAMILGLNRGRFSQSSSTPEVSVAVHGDGRKKREKAQKIAI